jgi:hypothetical protein
MDFTARGAAEIPDGFGGGSGSGSGSMVLMADGSGEGGSWSDSDGTGASGDVRFARDGSGSGGDSPSILTTASASLFESLDAPPDPPARSSHTPSPHPATAHPGANVMHSASLHPDATLYLPTPAADDLEISEVGLQTVYGLHTASPPLFLHYDL